MMVGGQDGRSFGLLSGCFCWGFDLLTLGGWCLPHSSLPGRAGFLQAL